MQYTLTLTPVEAKLIWEGLMQLQCSTAYQVAKSVEVQYAAAEEAAKQALTADQESKSVA